MVSMDKNNNENKNEKMVKIQYIFIDFLLLIIGITMILVFFRYSGIKIDTKHILEAVWGSVCFYVPAKIAHRMQVSLLFYAGMFGVLSVLFALLIRITDFNFLMSML